MEVRVVRRQENMESLESQGRLGLLKTEPDVAPEPTSTARLGARQLVGRQQESDVCGYYVLEDGDDWSTWMCNGRTTCNTIGTAFGCWPTVRSACYASTEVCSGNTRDLCCTDSDYPECWTGIKSVGNSEITAYVCAGIFWAFSMVENTERESTTTGTTVDTHSASDTAGVTGAGIPSTADPSETQPESSTSSQDVSATSEAANSGGASETPVGAIVGGAIGGVALIAFIAFALWYVRFHRKSAGAGSNGVQGGVGGPQHPAPGYESMVMQQPIPGRESVVIQQPTPGRESVAFQSQTLSPAVSENHSPSPLGSAALNSPPGQNFVVVAAADQSVPNAVKPGSPLLPYELPPNSPVRG